MLEEEAGMAHVMVFPSVCETCGSAICGHAVRSVAGVAQKCGDEMQRGAQATQAVV